MRVQNIFDVYSDPSHAWAKVPMRLLARMGLLNQVSPYSYMRGGFVYLEEDLDLSNFVTAYRQQFNKSPQFREHVSRTRPSKIRSYSHFVILRVDPNRRRSYIPGLIPLH